MSSEAPAKTDAPEPVPSQCKFFLSRKCRNGEECRFTHDLLADGLDKLTLEEEKEQQEAQDEAKASGKPGPEVKKPAAAASTSSGKPSGGGVRRHPNGSSIPGSARGRNPKRSACKFFVKGLCTNGASCRFSHDVTITPTHGGGGGGRREGGGERERERKPRPVCTFFKKGACINGTSCRFSHDVGDEETAAAGSGSSSASSSSSSRPNGGGGGVPARVAHVQKLHAQEYHGPVSLVFPPGTPIYSIDVECGATTKEHNGRGVISIGMVNEMCQPVCSMLIKQDPPVLSCLTPITGVTQASSAPHTPHPTHAHAHARVQTHHMALRNCQHVLGSRATAG